MLTVGSTFTGVGGADLGLEWAGFRIAWQCELDPWKRSILAAHWPDTPIYKDIVELADYVAKSGNRFPTEILHEEQQNRRISNSTPDTNSAITQRRFGDVDSVDVLIGGFPCQDLSVAGKRKGFDGERSVLAFEFLRVAESLAPRWLILENVPGLLSSNRGRDFARLVDEVVACGYGVSWRVLDARYFGVPQRRRRVFLVARRADALIDSGAASRLALRALLESGSGDPTPGWPPRQDTPSDAGGSPPSGRIVGSHGDADAGPTGTLTRMYSEQSGQDFGGGAGVVSFRKSKRAQTDHDDETWVESDSTNTLNRFDTGDTRATQIITAFAQNQREEVRDLGEQSGALTGQGTHQQTFVASTLQANHSGGVRMDAESAAGGQLVPDETTVRRLTPMECERLMGWPDGWTAPEGVKAPDSKRYAACGDGIVSWVAYWIGQRIRMIEEEA